MAGPATGYVPIPQNLVADLQARGFGGAPADAPKAANFQAIPETLRTQILARLQGSPRVATPAESTDTSLNQARADVGLGGSLAGLANRTASLFGAGPDITGPFTQAGNLFGGATGALDIARGNTATGALKLAPSLAAFARPYLSGFPASLAGAIGPAAGIIGGGLSLAQGNAPGGLSSLLSSGASLANLAPASMTLGGVPVSTAGAAAGLGAGEIAGASLAGALGSIGGVASLGPLFGSLLPLAFPHKPPWADYGNKANWTSATQVMPRAVASVESGTRGASTFADALAKIAVSPTVHGEYQIGVGSDYAGINNGTTSPGWTATIKALSDPKTLSQNPQAVVDFFKNLWVQTGPGGAAEFNPTQTRQIQENLLSKLPYTAQWNGLRQQILNAQVADPRTSGWQKNLAAVPQLPAKDGVLYLGNLAIPTDHTYTQTVYTGNGPVQRPLSPEAVGRVLQYGTTTDQQFITDNTTGKLVQAHNADNEGTVDPAYLAGGTDTPIASGLKASREAQAEQDAWQRQQDLQNSYLAIGFQSA